MLLCFVVKKTVIWYKNTTTTTPPTASVYQPTSHWSILARSHDRAQNDNRPYHFCANNEYIDGQFLAGSCGSQQRQVADGADVVFTDTRVGGIGGDFSQTALERP